MRRGLVVGTILSFWHVACAGNPAGLDPDVLVELNGGAAETLVREVGVRIVAPGAVELRLAEANLESAAFAPFVDSATWTFSPGDGPRTLLAQVRYSSGDVSEPAQQEIVLSEHIYASPRGDNASRGSYLSPKRTIAAAFAAAAARGTSTVRLFAGEYSPAVTGDVFPIRPPSGFVLEAVDTSTTTLNAQARGSVIRLEGVRHVSLRGLTLTGGSTTLGGGIYATDATALLERLFVRDNVATQGSGIFVDGGSDIVLRRSIVAFNRSSPGADAHGIQVENGGEAEIHNNTIALHDSNGILVRSASAVDMRNNIVYANGRVSPGRRGRGICELSDPHRSTLRYNLFFGNIVASVLFGGTGDISATAANEVSSTDGIAANFEADPLFVNASAGDFSLRSGSPAIDAGEPAAAFNDRDGSRNDIGHLGGT